MIRVITSSPVQIYGKTQKFGSYSNADSAPEWFTVDKKTAKKPMGPPAPTKAQLPSASTTAAPKKKFDWEKAKGVYGEAKEAGVIDQLKGKFFGGGNQGQTWDPSPAPEDTKSKMSTTTKVIIGVGIAVAVGTLIYVATRKTAPAK